ncbi:hypothetical protein [Fibrella forsythiae]|uniref:Sigma-70 family RNA polymerase sigma factor n=1 Tax=Fibrella forsythiae TaxID=2817061 RepID=A0ABS3JT89_9BACT|nr:hypothetical protein [Fibrella forsythiae]MBO0953229.1 hypothetical protein [Fibrella forsythiae]
MNEIKTNKEWEDLYECLYIFTDKLLKNRMWYKKLDDSSFIKGKQVHDYVSEGIERYMFNPEKYKPELGSIQDFIKFHIIRNLVRTDVVSSENTETLDIYYNSSEDESDSNYIESLFPYLENYFGDKIDYETVTNHINSEIEGNTILEEIFLGITSDLKRGDIIEQFNMSEAEYDNGMRRLKTVLKNTATKFGLKRQVI